MQFNFVYLTTNLINGKQYIGDHSTNNIKKDKYLGSGRLINKAIKKYKKENFVIKILEQFETRQEAFNAQIKYIKEYNTIQPFGYNISPTGGFKCNGKHSDETKKKISEANKGRIFSLEARKKMSNAKKGITLSEEHKRKISESEKGKLFSKEYREKLSKSKIGENNPMFNHNFSKEHREHLSLAASNISGERRKNLSNAMKNVKKIICNHCGKEFAPWGFVRHNNKLNKIYDAPR